MSSLRECEVCHNIDKVFVRASRFAPVNFAYCKSCITKQLEPYSVLLGITVLVGGLNNLEETYKRYIYYNLEEQGISLSIFEQDIKELHNNFI